MKISVWPIADAEGYFYNEHGRVTHCCQALVTYHEFTLCCKSCWAEVDNELLSDPVVLP